MASRTDRVVGIEAEVHELVARDAVCLANRLDDGLRMRGQSFQLTGELVAERRDACAHDGLAEHGERAAVVCGQRSTDGLERSLTTRLLLQGTLGLDFLLLLLLICNSDVAGAALNDGRSDRCSRRSGYRGSL